MKKIILTLAVGAVLLSSCGEKAPVPSNIPVAVTEALIDGKPRSEHIVKYDERIEITSLELWDEFNFDGNFSDNCLLFVRGFIEGYSKFSEFETLKISNWKITRDTKVYGYKMAFNFTVTESGLDSLPCGDYQTVITDATDCYIEFVSAPRDNVGVTVPESDAQKTVFDWLSYAQYYDYPDYAKWGSTSYAHYIRLSYGEDGKLEFSDFAALAKDKFGMEVTKEMFSGDLYVEDMKLYINTNASEENQAFDFVGEKFENGIYTVTVQHFADCNKLVKSYKIAYSIDADGRFISSEIIESSPYKPYGLRGLK